MPIDGMSPEENDYLTNFACVTEGWPSDSPKHVALNAMLKQANQWGQDKARRDSLDSDS